MSEFIKQRQNFTDVKLNNLTSEIYIDGTDKYIVLDINGIQSLIKYIPPTPTPTQTPTKTPTPTISVTPSITPTISVTTSITPTITNTPTITPTITNTPTVTPTKDICTVIADIEVISTTNEFVCDFDYMVLYFEFSSGSDFEIKTAIMNSKIPQTAYVGFNSLYGFPSNIPQGQLNNILVWGGNNTGLGIETVLVNLSKFKQYYPNETELKIDFRGWWNLIRGYIPIAIKA